MGYTHYFKTAGEIDQDKWDKSFIPAAKRIVNHAIDVSGIDIVGGNGDKDSYPSFNEDGISLNGSEENSYETMTISRRPSEFYFCKTARKPYDSVCVALALLADELFDEFSWTSDGDDEEDYDVEGRELMEAALN